MLGARVGGRLSTPCQCRMKAGSPDTPVRGLSLQTTVHELKTHGTLPSDLNNKASSHQLTNNTENLRQ